MLNITVLCVGKLKESFYIAAVREYEKRLKGYCKLTLLELPEEKLPNAPSQAQINTALEKEAQAIFSKLPKRATLVALCIEGKELSSEQLAQKFQQWATSGVSAIALVIGSSYGLHPLVKQQAALRLSMSPMTFPHHLARVMLLEQVYRAFKINEGSLYHK